MMAAGSANSLVSLGVISAAAVSLAGLTACGSSGPARPARISHVVFLKLEDPSRRAELLADCDAMLPGIPGVESYAAGRHLDVGRDSVDGDYDVGLYIGFETETDYAGYVEHPDHVAFVEQWKPALAWLRVHDIVDETE